MDLSYDLELDKIVAAIKKQKPKKVCLQLPDGLKPFADQIVDELKDKLKKEGLEPELWVWCGSAFGACDIPNLKGFDLLINFGHLRFRKFNTSNK